MPTYIYSKQDFIEFIEKQVKDTEVVVFSNELREAAVSKKKGLRTVMVFTEKAFIDEGCGHLYRKDTLPLGVIICPKKNISEEGLKAMASIQQSEEAPNPIP